MFLDKLNRTPSFFIKPPSLLANGFAFPRMLRFIIKKRPDIFARLGSYSRKTFLIDPVDMPFVFILRPDRQNPKLSMHTRNDNIEHHASISATFLRLLGLLDGKVDGDAMFFSRDLVIGGDTDAVVCLRNAIDDVEGSIADDVAEFFGLPASLGLNMLRKIKV